MKSTSLNTFNSQILDKSFKIIFEFSPISTQIFAINGDLIEVNKAWEELWETSIDEMKGYNILNDSLLSQKGIMPYIQLGFKGETVEIPPNKFTLKSTNGKNIDIHFKWTRRLIYPLKDENENILGIVVQDQDLTKQKIAQDEVLEHANYAKFIGEIGFILSRQRGLSEMLDESVHALIKYFNGSFARIWTLNTKDNVLELQASAGIYTHLDGEHSRILVGQFKIGLIAKTKEAHLTNNVLEDPLVSHKWAKENNMVAFAGYPLMVDEQIVGVMGMFASKPLSNIALQAMEAVANDIALSIEHKRSEQRLVESEERFRAMADNIPNLAWMADPDGWIFWYNNRWYEYTGTTPKQMEGWGWQSVHSPEALPEVLKSWIHSIKVGNAFEMIFPLKGADGIFRPFLTRVAPVRNTQGDITTWFGANTDITQQKELERQKDDFIGIASHELKTPVTSIKIFTQVLQKRFIKSGDMDSAGLLSKMDAQINKLTHLIEDLLDITKIESGKLRIEENNFIFDDLVNEIIEEIQRTTINHKIMKEGDIISTFQADRERVGQVILNLLTNAIKYSPKADKIIIRTQINKTHLILSVQDFGIGIPKSKQVQVFERFYRETGPKEDTFPGLGLGLYISKEIIERQGGRLWVDSTKGKGSTFSFELPLKK